MSSESTGAWQGPPAAGRHATSDEVKRRARAQFGPAAAAYVSDRIHREGDDLARMVELAALTGVERVLDVATGGGHTALAFAPHAGEVVALDLTPAMLEAASRYVRASGARNVSFRIGDAEAMEFADGEFDVLTARFAPHHFPRPEAFVSEASRVLRPGGRLVMFDNMVPEDDELDAFMNAFETWRDPSHVRARRSSEWQALMVASGLAILAADPLVRRTYEFQQWAAKQSMPEHERDALELWLLAAPRRCAEYFDLAVADGRLVALRATFGVIAARKPPAAA